jgi:hypothetical protein
MGVPESPTLRSVEFLYLFIYLSNYILNYIYYSGRFFQFWPCKMQYCMHGAFRSALREELKVRTVHRVGLCRIKLLPGTGEKEVGGGVIGDEIKAGKYDS